MATYKVTLIHIEDVGRDREEDACFDVFVDAESHTEARHKALRKNEECEVILSTIV